MAYLSDTISSLTGGVTQQVPELRHTTATRLAKRGASIRMVQEFMGHENIETTTRYMHLADNWGDDIRKLLD